MSRSNGFPRALGLTLLLSTLWIVGCATDNSTSLPTSSSGSQGGGSPGAGGAGGGQGGSGGVDLGPCGQDCSAIVTPQCLTSVCNEGQYLGTVGACLVVPSTTGTTCDDGLFCTVNDTCDKGECLGGPPNDCGAAPAACTTSVCDESSKSCAPSPADEGASCVATGLCEINGACHGGQCLGEPKDCTFAPQSECNTMSCNPTTGACEPTPDASKNGKKCLLTGDLCMVGRTCAAGQCAGGSPKDCSALTVGCNVGACNPINGSCDPKPVPPGGTCFDGITECHVGICDAGATCQSMPVPDGTACNDHDSCTGGDTCSAGACAGMAAAGCLVYFEEGFEACPGGWKLGGDWQCGTPTTVGPATAHTGTGVIATQIHGKYNSSQTYAVAVAASPTINLGSATQPKLSFWAWIDTEGSSYDGFNLEVSSDAGATFTQTLAVTPVYDLTIGGRPAWGGHHADLGWQSFTADLSAYAGQQIILRFAFRSDGSGTYPGVYIDDLMVAEAAAIPLVITTPAPLSDVYSGVPSATAIQKTGGSSSSAWTIVAGTNHGWMSIDPASGVLGGTPAAANAGPVSVTIHVEEPTVPANFAEKTYTFNVVDVGSAIYFGSFEGVCPNGWALGGDWECGVPTAVGPAMAYGGSQCLATKIGSDYSYSQAWATTTATSPALNLAGTMNPHLAFRMWINTEGSSYDGANLKISTDGGATFTLLGNVVPAYTLTINGEPAWGGDQSALGWQPIQADLTAYAGQSILLRFAFRSDSTSNRPGVYVDDVLVTAN